MELLISKHSLITSLAKEVMFSVALFGCLVVVFCLSVCLSFCNIADFMEGSGVVTETSDKSLVAIQIIMLSAQSEVQPLLNKLGADCVENFQTALQ